jgi:hypothetical protein
VTTTVWLVGTVTAVAPNVPVLAPGATDTLAGTVSAAALLDSATVAPATPLNVTVQVATMFKEILVGLHATEVNTVGDKSVRDAFCDPPLNVAVITAIWPVATVPAVAVKLALVVPAATSTVAGTVSAVALLETATAAPPDPAG